ncbi:MAG: 16S rRNA (cytosine(967)-C(5))-methyltransferase RsmB [Clostridiales bacterium]|nr:16S rRNA (cytosine(967)-C(5))-methyltransferase RsmB [Clostridiales bacterium]
MENSRKTALKILYEVEYNGAYPNMAVKNALHGDLTRQERAFVSALVYGCVDKKLTLDYMISQLSHVKLKKLSKYILLILRMGIYQIMFMESVPDSAAVNESVKLAKRYGHGASAGYVNGVLRSLIRSAPSYPSDPVLRMAVEYSCPEWLLRKWLDEFGEEFTRALLEGFLKKPELILRPNTLKITASQLVEKLKERGMEARECDGAVICGGFDIAYDALYAEGLYTVQDLAAMQAARVLDPRPGECVIDMCAAPGGKTTHIAELMENRGKILAFDIFEHKTELIRKNAARLGIDIIQTRVADTSKYAPALAKTADKILCDVPCSGTGILRRKPDIKWNRDRDFDFPALQRRILANALRYLKDGGVLVYSTCSVEREENEGVTSQAEGFEKLYEKTFYPHIDDTDGFYICKLRKI